MLTSPLKGDISTVASAEADAAVALMGRWIHMDVALYLKVSTWLEEKEVNNRPKLKLGLSQLKSDLMVPNHAR